MLFQMLQQIDGLCRNWHDVVITKLGDTVTWEVDGHLLATVDTTKIMFGGENILIVYSDTNDTISSDPNAATLLFGLYLRQVFPQAGHDIAPGYGAPVLIGGGAVMVTVTVSGSIGVPLTRSLPSTSMVSSWFSVPAAVSATASGPSLVPVMVMVAVCATLAP